MLSKDRYVSAFSTDAALLLDLATTTPGAPVPSCGDWAVADLVAHLGGVWGFMLRHVANRAAERDGGMDPLPLEGAELIDSARRIAADLGQALADVAPDEAVWSWTGDRTGGFYLRRATQETAVHLWDVRNALGIAEPLADDIARDGIDELVDVTYPNLLERGVPEPTGSLHLHCTDGDGEWSMQVADGAVLVTRTHEKGDAALRGTAGDLALALWERVSLDAAELQLFGNVDVAAGWAALTR